MLRKTLISGAAIAALTISGAAFAQGNPGGAAGSGGPSPNASGNATGPAPGVQNRNDVPRGTPGSTRAQERTGTSDQSPNTTQSNQGQPGAGSPSGSPGRSGATTGQNDNRGGSSSDRVTTGQTPKVQISDQQRTQLRSRFKEANIRTVTRDQINVSIAVGAVLPSTVTFAPIPAPIVTLVPEFRGYQAVQVGNQILIVEPGTRRIVYVIEI